MKWLSKVLSNRKISEIVLKHLDVSAIRLFLGRNFLSPIETFILDGYHDKLYSDLPINEDSNVIILGGYEGASAHLLHESYSSNIFVVEPIPQYAQVLRRKFMGPKFKIFEFAVSNTNENVKIGLMGEKSGVTAESDQITLVNCRRASEFMREIEVQIDLVEMNIEGSEYAVLDDLISSSLIKEIRCLLIQFHGDSIENEAKRSILRLELSKTHFCVFNYSWIWERWDLITN